MLYISSTTRHDIICNPRDPALDIWGKNNITLTPHLTSSGSQAATYLPFDVDLLLPYKEYWNLKSTQSHLKKYF